MLAVYFGIKMNMKGGINAWFVTMVLSALGMGLFSLFPLLIIHQLSSKKTTSPATHKLNENDAVPDPELDSDEWEFATEDELQSGEFEVG